MCLCLSVCVCVRVQETFHRPRHRVSFHPLCVWRMDVPACTCAFLCVCCLFVCLSACLAVCPSVRPSVCLRVCESVCLSVRVSVCLSVCLCVLCVCLTLCLCLCVCLRVLIFVCWFVLCVCAFIFAKCHLCPHPLTFDLSSPRASRTWHFVGLVYQDPTAARLPLGTSECLQFLQFRNLWAMRSSPDSDSLYKCVPLRRFVKLWHPLAKDLGKKQ